jgi:glutathione S-transferase
MITVHHLDNSRSQRVLWLLEELGLPYEIKHYKRDRKTMLAPPELRQVHPLGKSPVVTDGDITLAESGAIIEYLVQTYGREALLPRDAENQRRYTYWLHFAEGSAMSPLLMKLIFDRVRKAPLLVRPIANAIANQVMGSFVQPNIDRQLSYIESELAARPWFAGPAFSAADIQMSFPLEVSEGRVGLPAEKYPRINDFLKRIRERPAYGRALEKGGPFKVGK